MRGITVASLASLSLLVAAAPLALAVGGPDLSDILRAPEDGLPGGDDAESIVRGAVSGGSSDPVGPPNFDGVAERLDGLDAAALVPLAILAGAAGVLGALFFFGGTRYVTREDVLKNDVRGRIYSYLRDKVGANLKQITDDLHLTTTNAIWHLRKLEDVGLIHSRRFNGYKVFYPAEGGVEARRLSLSMTALSNENAQEVFEFVVSNPGAHQREIARALGVNHGTVRWHLKKLRRAELLTELKKGKASAYYPTDIGNQALATVVRNRAVPSGLVMPPPPPAGPVVVTVHHL